MAKKTNDDRLVEEVSKFIFEFSNVCWNLAEQGEYKKAQRLGVTELLSRVPRLTREFLAATAVKGSPNLEVVQLLDEVLSKADEEIAKNAAKNADKKPAKKTVKKTAKK